MGLETLKQELGRKTQSEVQRLDAEVRLEARRIKEDAKKELQRRREAAQKEAEEFVEIEKMRIPAARLKAKRILQDAKYQMVSEALGFTAQLLEKKTSNKREYEKLLEQLIGEGIRHLGTKQVVIMVRKQDIAFAKKFGKTAELDCAGGAIICSEDGRMRINNTFEALLEKNKEELEQHAFESMFGKASK
ncbi:MAG: V-type ATP synthase subunit E [Candidatus Micrarchaeota archaeon]